MKVVEVRREAELSNLGEKWANLCAKSASDTIFLSWEWVSSWWAVYGKPGELRILLTLDEKDELRGIAPLYRRAVRKYGQTYNSLFFIGDGSSDSDYLDFIAAAGDEPEVIRSFWDHLQPEFSRGTLLQLNEIPSSSPNIEIFRGFCAQAKLLWRETDVPCSTVALPSDWPAYLSKLAPRFRTKVRSVLRNVESREELQFHFCGDAKELDFLLPALFDLHSRRWAKEANPGVFRTDQKQLFYRMLSAVLLQRGWLCFSWLEWNHKILACQYGFVYRNCYFQLQEGYEPLAEHWNVGIALRAWSIQQFLKCGVRDYDFMAGVGRHKSDWGSDVKLSKRIVVGCTQARNRLFCDGPRLEVQIRESLRGLTPQRLLATREAFYKRRAASRFESHSAAEPANAGRMPWARSLLAQAYFHSPLPALLPRVRNRYRLGISSSGRLPRINWQKRNEPSLRILYFHRVNNENDPFSWALSPTHFEEEMRFVAQRYQVVSLTEAARRLSRGGPPEPLVAITFDDGFRDNYLNAFPILQRYGLTATIFLTTGSIDTGEALWFERLSRCVKTASQQFIDVEIDIPRRLWMRTESERLQTKNRLIALLRPLPDSERRLRLNGILTQLGESARPDNVMLTWDEVRSMKKYGIDFGGHTVTHPFVSRLEPEQAVWEISECKKRIESEVQDQVLHFAYPNGREEDFASWNKTVIQEAGYQAAVSTLWGINYPSTDRMELRRGQPWEENQALFAAKLDWYQLIDG